MRKCLVLTIFTARLAVANANFFRTTGTMATLRFTLVHVLLCLFHRVGSTPALLAKRDVIKHCTNGFNSMLQAGIQDAATIVRGLSGLLAAGSAII
jgi:hypothetical protein